MIEKIIRFHIHMMLYNFDEDYVANHEWKHLKEPYLSNFIIQRRGYEQRLITFIESGILAKELKKLTLRFHFNYTFGTEGIRILTTAKKM